MLPPYSPERGPGRKRSLWQRSSAEPCKFVEQARLLLVGDEALFGLVHIAAFSESKIAAPILGESFQHRVQAVHRLRAMVGKGGGLKALMNIYEIDSFPTV